MTAVAIPTTTQSIQVRRRTAPRIHPRFAIGCTPDRPRSARPRAPRPPPSARARFLLTDDIAITPAPSAITIEPPTTGEHRRRRAAQLAEDENAPEQIPTADWCSRAECRG